MRINQIKNRVIAIFLILAISSCTKGGTFVVTDIVVPDNLSETRIQEIRDKVIGTEVFLLFSDNDVRMTAMPKEGKSQSMILQKIGENLYRGTNKNEMLELELNTFFYYIKSCKISIYDIPVSGTSMVWDGTMILSQK